MSDDGLSSNGGVLGMKRPATDDISYPNSEKRAMVIDKVAVAAEAAARLTQKLNAVNPQLVPTLNPNITETTEIPDRYVGLVIGKKGEQIMSLQNESACKVQISQAGTPERTVTLTGTPQQIEHAKRLIGDIIEKAEKNGPVAPSVYVSGGEVTTVELMVPGMKAGLIIGRSGDTIKKLQEDNNVKMVLIQQSNSPTSEDKPLRISGEQVNVERARMTVLNLLNTRDRPGGGPMSGYGEETTQCAVPAEKAGLVIGKGGASIKEICLTSGAHVEISKDPPPDPTIKLFNVRGSRMAIDQAVRMICDRVGIPVSRSTVNNASGAWGQYGYPQSDQWGMGGANGAPQAAVAQAGVPTPSLNPCTGQLDYSAAWADYYRKHGMNDFAEAIMRQCAQPGAQPSQVQPSMVPNQPVAPSQPPSQMPVQGAQPQQGQQFDYNQWQWQQWQAWQQAWQQQAGAPGQPTGGYPPQGSMPGGRPHMPEQ